MAQWDTNINPENIQDIKRSVRFSTQQTETIQSLQENAITVFGPRLYNSLPKYQKDIEIVKTRKFKFELDKFLELIPDEPKIQNYVTAARSSSILDQLSHHWVQGMCQGGGVADSAMEQASCFETTPSIQVRGNMYG